METSKNLPNLPETGDHNFPLTSNFLITMFSPLSLHGKLSTGERKKEKKKGYDSNWRVIIILCSNLVYELQKRLIEADCDIDLR